ncbi:MAG: DNA-processing protein DprA [Epsilonproteobacteria bacterium]|nr:DNA-processing protein DprA [Campylobacterota bacterium]
MTKVFKELPKELEDLKDRPKNLFYRGDISLLNSLKVSIVGTRHPISYTKQFCLKLGAALKKRGVIVVSGGAMGVDALAHKSAFPNTIGVMANSLDIFYPKVNLSLLKNMEKESLLLSEYESNMPATRYSFVLRNRIVVALGEVLIVAQADLNSGSMRSVEIAQKYGKKIYVLPHRLGDSLGTNALLSSHEATVIYDIEKFADMFGVIEKYSDEILDFCEQNSNLQDVIKKFGDKIYTYELEGKIEIKNLQVRVL